jgi:hypothetical protein
MHTTIKATAAAVTIFLSYSSAHAVDVQYFSTTEEFARKVGTYYEEAPAALKAKMLGAKVIAVGDTATFYKIQLANGAPKNLAANFSNGTYVAVAWQGSGTTKRTLTFVREKFEQSFLEYQRCSVFHEMAHLWDFGPIGHKGSLSDSANYRRAFNADKNAYAAYVKRNPKDKVMLDDEIGYYFSKPQEAFAESAARALCSYAFKPQEQYVQKLFELFLPQTFAHVKVLMQSAGIINGDGTPTNNYASR